VTEGIQIAAVGANVDKEVRKMISVRDRAGPCRPVQDLAVIVSSQPNQVAVTSVQK
jgi:hypothetical protein